MAGADRKQQLLVKVHDCTKISHEFMSEKCALGKKGFQKNLLSVIYIYIKKKSPKETSTRLLSQAGPHHHHYSRR